MIHMDITKFQKSASFYSSFSLRWPSLSKYTPEIYPMYYFLISGVKPDSDIINGKTLFMGCGIRVSSANCPAQCVKQPSALHLTFPGPNLQDGTSVQPRTGCPTSPHSCSEANTSEPFFVWNPNLMGLFQHTKDIGGGICDPRDSEKSALNQNEWWQ